MCFDRAVAAAASLAVFGLLAACTPTSVVTGVAQAAWEDRSTQDQVDDVRIATGILKRLVDEDKNLLLDVSGDTWEKRVMLTGTLDDPAVSQRVEDLVWEDERVEEVNNVIQIVSAVEKEEQRALREKTKEGGRSVGETINDLWIVTKIKVKLVSTRGVTSVNYRWRSVRKTVYVIGRARSEWELNTVLGIIRGTDGVKGVEHFIVIKPPGA